MLRMLVEFNFLSEHERERESRGGGHDRRGIADGKSRFEMDSTERGMP